MKREAWLTLLTGTLLSFLLSFSGTFCIATAFDLYADGLANLLSLALWCALISLLGSLCYTWRMGFIVPAALAVLAFCLWYYGSLAQSVEALCNTISIRYNNGYHWGILQWSGADLAQIDRTMALQAVGSIIAMSTAWTVCRKRPVIWAILAGLLPLIVCTVLTTTVPSKTAIFLWLLAMAMLLLTQSVRRHSAAQGNKLAIYSILPVAFALALLFALIPQEEYSGEIRAASLLQRFEAFFTKATAINGGREEIVDLTRVGRMRQSFVPVMEVSASYSGNLYLRGRAYDVYTGTQWKDGDLGDDLPWASERIYQGQVTVTTRDEEDVLYLPYYTESMLAQQVGNVLWNDDGKTSYSYDCYSNNSSSALSVPNEAVLHAMTALPTDTRLWAEAKVQEILNESLLAVSYTGPEATAMAVQRYLSSYGRYDLSTPRMDSGSTDFAQWFLTESDTGYCIHYATAATVLLRAAGIPARYVTGFTVESFAGENVTVYQKNAHAWVEYWTQTSGWQILDPTPAAENALPVQTTTAPAEESAERTTAPTVTTAVPTESKDGSTQSTASSGESGTANTASKAAQITAFLQVLQWFAYAALPIGLIVGQWRLRVALRKRARQRGAPNERALCAYRQAICYARALGEKPAPALKDLAQKAKFSPYVLTVEELRQFESYFAYAIDRLRQKSLPMRLFYRVILALY